VNAIDREEAFRVAKTAEYVSSFPLKRSLRAVINPSEM
jgi:hypothetical protein